MILDINLIQQCLHFTVFLNKISSKGKPVFDIYGYNNVNPACGGVAYGNYMLTHNANPHRGENKPEFV